MKGVGFMKPYFEASGACAGCGETPYYRLASQLFGSDMKLRTLLDVHQSMLVQAPSTPCTDRMVMVWLGLTPLFEDNAEFGFSMKLAENYMSKHILEIIEANKNDVEPRIKEILEKYEAVKGSESRKKALYNELVEKVEASANEPIKELLDMKGELVTKSQWIIGGDGWAYDIGYGGLDHVLANDQNVNVLVLDTSIF